MSCNCFKFSLCGVAIRLKHLLFKTRFRAEDVEYVTSAAAGSCCVHENMQRSHTTAMKNNMTQYKWVTLLSSKAALQH